MRIVTYIWLELRLAVLLHLIGSDSCEFFFSKIGGMERHERAYDLQQFVNIANTLIFLITIEYKDNGLKSSRVHKKNEQCVDWPTSAC